MTNSKKKITVVVLLRSTEERQETLCVTSLQDGDETPGTFHSKFSYFRTSAVSDGGGGGVSEQIRSFFYYCPQFVKTDIDGANNKDFEGRIREFSFVMTARGKVCRRSGLNLLKFVKSFFIVLVEQGGSPPPSLQRERDAYLTNKV